MHGPELSTVTDATEQANAWSPDDVVLAEIVSGPPPLPPAQTHDGRGVWRGVKGIGRGLAWLTRSIASAIEWLFGAASLIIGLSVLAAIPVVQMLSLGYLLEASARAARTGRLSAAFIGIRQAARLGGIALGFTLLALPVVLISSLAASAELIDPDGPTARRWQLGAAALAFVLALHALGAMLRGGRLRHFLIPFVRPIKAIRRLRRGGFYADARDNVWDFVISLQLPHYFWLGFRGFIGGLAWLAIPISLVALGPRAPVLAWIGAALFIWVAYLLPFLQVHLAVEDRFLAMFERRTVKELFNHAPIAFFTALVFTLVSAIPLYLLKIEMIPREAAWLPSLVFVIFIFPVRVLTGWAYGRARRHEARRWFGFRWLARLGCLAVTGIYLFIVFFTQYTSWYGIWSLYEQHAFLVPVPFLDLR